MVGGGDDSVYKFCLAVMASITADSWGCSCVCVVGSTDSPSTAGGARLVGISHGAGVAGLCEPHLLASECWRSKVDMSD